MRGVGRAEAGSTHSGLRFGLFNFGILSSLVIRTISNLGDVVSDIRVIQWLPDGMVIVKWC